MFGADKSFEEVTTEIKIASLFFTEGLSEIS
jgi:hypothetical protein